MCIRDSTMDQPDNLYVLSNCALLGDNKTLLGSCLTQEHTLSTKNKRNNKSIKKYLRLKLKES